MLKATKDGILLWPHRVKYKRYDGKVAEEKGNWAMPSETWWERTCKKHKHLELVGFEEIKLTREQQERYEEVEKLVVMDGFLADYTEYILNGKQKAGDVCSRISRDEEVNEREIDEVRTWRHRPVLRDKLEDLEKEYDVNLESRLDAEWS